MNQTNLNSFNNNWYKPGRGKLVQLLWYYINSIFFKTSFFPFYSLKIFFLRVFGAEVGRNVIIKPSVNIKYPWRLKIKDNSWIGEGVWIDNLADVSIGSNCCLSQGSFILTGNHNYKKKSFDLEIGNIQLEDGVWIGAYSVVTPGITCKSHSVLSVNSVATKDLDPYSIYQGNPAVFIRNREL